MNNISRNVMLLAALSSTTAIAGTMGSDLEAGREWVLQLSLGPVWADAGKKQDMFLAPDIAKGYMADNKFNSLFNGEIFAGQQKTFSDSVKGQLGLAFAATGNAHLQGNIWDDADPEFDNYRYSYKVRSTRLMIKGVAIFDNNGFLAPFVSAGAGVSFNRAHTFDNTPLIFEAVPNANFTNNTKSSFSYALAAGVQKTFQTRWQAGLRYEFSDWGKSELGIAPGQSQGTGLRLNHLYTNGVLFHLTYIV